MGELGLTAHQGLPCAAALSTTGASLIGSINVIPKISFRRNTRKSVLRSSSVLVATAVAVALAGCAKTTSNTNSGTGPPKSGGSLTVLEGSTFAGAWPGLDPATDTDGAANMSYMDAIFGELFELTQGGKTTGDLATGYKFTNGGKTVVVTLRQGVKFSDGTPFNADAVVFNWKRDLNSTCTCKPRFIGTPTITATGPYEVSLTLSYVDAPFINALQGSVFNWIASPTAIKSMAAKDFALKPVGAGPFTVETDVPDSLLVLKKNPNYWEKAADGTQLPYLNTLTFKPVGSDTDALTALESGAAQAYEGMSTPSLVSSFKAKFQTTAEPSTSPYDIQLNTKIPPFNNITARQAIYAATDTALLDKSLFNNTYPVGQSFTAPAGLFYEKTVPGYITYDLQKAKQLVSQVPGGINIQLGTLNAPVANSVDVALKNMWEAAGMHVTLQSWDLTGLIGAFTQGKWQAMLQTAGAYDPGTGVGVGFRFSSLSPFTGVHDTKLDGMLNAAAATTDQNKRHTIYNNIAAYIAQNAYGPFLFPIAGYNIAAKGVGGPGLNSPLPVTDVNPEILWQYVFNNNNATG
ncbi:MAG: ABC transporter substrate-binding protein [Actinobacteria bacterium]|nr:ABC transporter substrate-binding protein [Actinomycetota bacterium]